MKTSKLKRCKDCGSTDIYIRMNLITIEYYCIKCRSTNISNLKI